MSENGQATEQPSNNSTSAGSQRALDGAEWIPVLRKVSVEVDDYPFATAAGKAKDNPDGTKNDEPRKREVKKDRVWMINLKAPSEAVALASKLMDAPED